MSFNYKKNKLDQLAGFCSTVECANSISRAAERNNISATTISKQISSLEEDLGFLVFDRVKNRMILNQKGKEYYKEARAILDGINKLYNQEIVAKNNFIDIYKYKLSSYFYVFRFWFFRKVKMIVLKITWGKLVAFFLLIFLAIWLYLYQTNWFFDQKLKSLANPLLREILEEGYYRVKSQLCPFETAQIYLDMSDIMGKIISNKNINMYTISVYDCPNTPMRMNNNEENDQKFYNSNYIKCDTKRRFEAYKQQSIREKNLLMFDNYKYYMLYRKTDCLNFHTFEENLKKYPNLISAKLTNDLDITNGVVWIIKNGSYYYMFLETNGKQGGHNLDAEEERYLIFKKLTLNQLMHYDKSSYWKLIKDYNIKID